MVKFNRNKFTNNVIADVLIYFTYILILSLIISLLIFFIINFIVNYDLFFEKNNKDKFESFLKVITISISITGFLSIIIAIISTKKSFRKDLQQTSLTLLKEFNSKEFRIVRKSGWQIFKKYYNDENYRSNFINFIEDGNFSDDNIYDDIMVVYTILDFYLLVSISETDIKLLRATKFYNYGWWRPFLYEISEKLENSRRIDSSFISRYNKNYIQNISYTNHLKKMDDICGFKNFPPKKIIHINGV